MNTPGNEPFPRHLRPASYLMLVCALFAWGIVIALCVSRTVRDFLLQTPYHWAFVLVLAVAGGSLFGGLRIKHRIQQQIGQPPS